MVAGVCAACVAQGIGYVGGALTSLQVMAARAKAKRADHPRRTDTPKPDRELEPAITPH
jgi:hypothetical protein